MFNVLWKKALPVLCIGFLTACEVDKENLDLTSGEKAYVTEPSLLSAAPGKTRPATGIYTSPEVFTYSENFQDKILNAVAPTECSGTKLSEVQWKYFTALAGDTVALAHFEHYRYLNRYAPLVPLGKQYFGKNGEYTGLVQGLQRDLERFWNMPNEIKVLGQHNETLNDREKLVEIMWYLIEDVEEKEQLYDMADELIYYNSLSPVLPESPFFASDGYASLNKKIVIGDGIIQMFVETGLEETIVWTGILAHEWSHQIQFAHLQQWYPTGSFESKPEETRTLELEADFLSGYYMTHKRGATFNWKRAEQFFELFYQSGDCSFQFEQHHGTPQQRKQASYEGYLLAEAAQKRGKILSAEELHDYFLLKVLPETVRELQYL